MTRETEVFKILYIFKRANNKIRRDEMTFLAIDAQKNLFTLQKSQLQFEQTLIMSRVNSLTKQIGFYEADFNEQHENDDVDIEDDAFYKNLQRQEAYLETKTRFTGFTNQCT